MQAILTATGAALVATLFPFLCTSTGAVLGCIAHKQAADSALNRATMGFAGGVMLAASVFSLLLPAAERAEQQGYPGWIAACGGFGAGAAFLLLLDAILRKAKPGYSLSSFAITLHNLPEGMAVGLTAALAVLSGSGLMAGAGALAFGVGIQNIPEGAAVALPTLQRTQSRRKALQAGIVSGIVEPIGAIAAALLAGVAAVVLPWLLAFAAGAMVYVTSEELIPTACSSEKGIAGTMGVLVGFVLMMALDLALG